MLFHAAKLILFLFFDKDKLKSYSYLKFDLSDKITLTFDK